MNQELPSVNEELQKVNIEYRAKIQELIELNNNLDNLIESTKIGLVFLDTNLKIRKFTSATKKIINIRDTDINRPLEKLSYEFDLPNFIKLLQQVISNNQPIEQEIQLKNSEQYFLMRVNPYHVDEQNCNGVVISFIGLDKVTDIRKAEQALQHINEKLEQRVKERTLDLEKAIGYLQQEIRDRKKAQKALKKSELFFRNTFEKAGIGIAHVNLEGKFRLLNQKFCQIAGYPHNILINLDFQNITHPDDLELYLQYVRETIAGEREGYTMEKRYIRSDDSPVWINLTVSLVKNEQDEPEYFIAAIQDISERKAIAQALKEANQAKDTFISQMNHELRTPLNSIIGFAQILQKDPTLNEQQQQTLDLIASSGQYLQALINSILEFSKIEAGKNILKQKDFNLSQLLDTIANTIRHRVEEKGLIFNYHWDSSVPVIVQGDKIKLQQLLFNLLDNAVKFTDTGSITFNITNISDQESNTLCPKIRFQITDTGIGISPQNIENIFQPFIHIEKDGIYREGTGLGLTISQKIAQLMGSKIQVTSKENEGTICWFELNLPEGNINNISEQVAEDVSLTNSSMGQGLTILVVDDIAYNRYLLVQHLKYLGFKTVEATNGQECLAIAEKIYPSVILLDFLMPGMDGIETLRRLRQHPQLKNTVVIFISASFQIKSQLNTANLQFEDFLVKPVNLQELSNSLEKHLDLRTSETNSNTIKITPPNSEQLREILQLTNIGDLEAVIQLANDFQEGSDNQYSSCFQEVIKLAQTFQQNKLIKFLEQLIID